MQFSTSVSLLAVAASYASAEIHKVAVGQNGLTFTPNNLDAQVGDFVEFAFFPKVCPLIIPLPSPLPSKTSN